MAKKQVIELKDFDPTGVTFSKKTPSLGGGGRYCCFVNHRGVSTGSKWFLQTPMMRAPFGVSMDSPTQESSNGMMAGGGVSGVEGGTRSMKMALSFGGNDPDVDQCLNKLIELEKHVIDMAVKNSKEWFGKECTREVLESMFYPIVKKNRTGQWPDLFSVKIPTNSDGRVLLDQLYSFDTEAGTMQSVPVGEICDHIVRSTDVQVIFSFTQLYFTGTRGFGISLKAQLVRFVPNPLNADVQFLDECPEKPPFRPTKMAKVVNNAEDQAVDGTVEFKNEEEHAEDHTVEIEEVRECHSEDTEDEEVDVGAANGADAV